MTAPATDQHLDEEGLAEDIGFGKAIIIGSVAGIVVMVLGLVALIKVLAPDMPIGAVLAVSVWTGVWAGLFLGGTVTVGRWAGARH
ncbi:MAG TPA: hypothetical protein VIJ47_08240 [Acidimicrobiales bacterium]